MRISIENIAVGLTVAVGLADEGLLRHITAVAEELEQGRTLQRTRRKWLGNPHTDRSLAMH